jgi:selenide, water dikinase
MRSNGRWPRLPVGLTLGAAGSRPQPWLAGTGLHLHQGFVTVGPPARGPRVFAAGDCAHMAHAPRPKAGVFAVRQAPVLAAQPARGPVGRARCAASTRSATTSSWSRWAGGGAGRQMGPAAEGGWLWRLKDRIDRRFMRMFHDLPAMPAPACPPRCAGLAEALGDKPLCGGCGAKIGPGALRAALAGYCRRPRAMWHGRGRRCRGAAAWAGRQVIATDHLRAVTEDPWLMARIAATHALGDIWAMGAKPQAALASLILPRLSEALQERTLAEIMAGASRGDVDGGRRRHRRRAHARWGPS